MYFFYVDESGTRDPEVATRDRTGRTREKDWLYVLTAVSLLDQRWHGFEKTIWRHKARLIDEVRRRTSVQLQQADCEIKSNWVRIHRERTQRRFLKDLTDSELTELIDLYYRQLDYHHMFIFTALVDKRHLHAYMDREKLHRKSWELLCEMIEGFMSVAHDRHQAAMIVDDVGPQMNRSLAMKHAYHMDQGTGSGTWLRHLCEMPLFVRSELSNGIQLADLCAYNIYRAFRDNDMEYAFFQRVLPRVWRSNVWRSYQGTPFSGFRVFPPESPLVQAVETLDKERAPRSEPGAPGS